jgi:UDPglucose 6-dehydrogenase
MRKPTLAIIGYGYVGKAISAFFERTTNICIYDPALGHTNKEAADKADFAVICVPTPMSDTGAVDLTYIRETFEWLKTPLIIIKSTIPPGTTDSLRKQYALDGRICFSPEYIGEGNYPVPYWNDIPHPIEMEKHSFHIFGGDKKATRKAIAYWTCAGGPFAKYLQTDAATAELVKYAENSWIATKITYMNELYDIAETFGSDFNELRELFLLDGRVGRSHTLVYPNRRGFHGKCIPKDTNGIVAQAKSKGYTPHLLEKVLEVNKLFLNLNEA